jgi:hypothetical protein
VVVTELLLKLSADWATTDTDAIKTLRSAAINPAMSFFMMI